MALWIPSNPFQAAGALQWARRGCVPGQAKGPSWNDVGVAAAAEAIPAAAASAAATAAAAAVTTGAG